MLVLKCAYSSVIEGPQSDTPPLPLILTLSLLCLYYNHPPPPSPIQEMEQKLQSAEKQGGQRSNSSVIASSHKNEMSLGGLLMTLSAPSPTPYRPEAILATWCTLCVQWLGFTESANSEDCCLLIFHILLRAATIS